MKDKTTTITNPENGDTKMFAYDHSYWSHDSYRETQSGIYETDSPGGPYVDQVSQTYKQRNQVMVKDEKQFSFKIVVSFSATICIQNIFFTLSTFFDQEESHATYYFVMLLCFVIYDFI